MQTAIQICGYLVGLPLELLILAALLRGAYKEFPLVFLYVVVDFLTSVIEIRPSLAYVSRTPHAVREWALIYWVDERIMQVLVFLLVISLIYRAAGGFRPRRTLLALLVCGTLLFAGVSFFLHYDARVVPGRWMTPWTRDLNLCATILDLALWAMLIAPRKKNYRLLMLSGALGIRFTGQAIGQSLRQIGQSLETRSPSLVLAGSILIMLANLVCLYLWWRTFAVSTVPVRGRPQAQGSGPRGT